MRHPLRLLRLGGWDELSDLDAIVVHQAADDESASAKMNQVLDEIRERHYPGCRDWKSHNHEVTSGQLLKTPEDFVRHRRTINHVVTRAARDGLIFTKKPGDEAHYRHDGDVSNE